MRPLKVLATALALSFLAAPAFAEARPAKPPAAAKAARDKKADPKAREAKREARFLEALKNAGIDEARAKKVVAVVKKYHAERAPVRQEMRKHREAMRENTDQGSRAKAKEAMEAQRKKLAEIQKRQEKDIRALVKPDEQAKVLQAVKKAKKHKRGAGAKKHNAKKASHGAA